MPKKEPLELIWNKMHACMDYILGLYWYEEKAEACKMREGPFTMNSWVCYTGKMIGDN